MQPLYTVRLIEKSDLPFLWDMLCEAENNNAKQEEHDNRKAPYMPLFRKYLEHWGRWGDTGIIAVTERGHRLGAAWYRLFPPQEPGYGFVSPGVPELSITVRPEARGLGVGSALLQVLLGVAYEVGYKRISLAIERDSSALKFYQRYGFHDAGISQPTDTTVTLIHSFACAYEKYVGCVV
uniref:N-acetyltransferase domain-containing protein n=1 Tax=Thermosporothrix sp. COM3 TaxID=2490863 RepID=A0A455SFQ4_9CHLR|nr:hypothetical protein KTC_05730 [Thermosporothrix sp. COM3]